MADPIVAYPFDPTGQAVSNRILGEQIIIIPPGDRLFHFSMPRFAPFYEVGLNLRLRDVNNNVIPLIKGIDYYLSHKFMDASLATMHPLYGSFTFLRRDIVGTLLVDYNTLGGPWTLDQQKITEILLDQTRNPRVVSWEQVTERPVDFPVIDHPWNLDDMVGQKEILETLENFYNAYLASLDPESGGGSGPIVDHINNRSNPHQVTAAQVGAYSTTQINTMLTAYAKLTDTIANSQRLDGKTRAEVMADVVLTKVDAAAAADDSSHLAGKTLAQIMQDAAAQTAANSNKLEGKTLQEVSTQILAGKAADSGKLDGKTYQEIYDLLSQAAGDATSLSGKTLTQLMNDVKLTKVDRATAADSADNAAKLDGKTLSEVLLEVAGVVPDNALNAQKVYGYTFDQLVQNILESDEYADFQPFAINDILVEGQPILNPQTGGTQDANFTYTKVGEFQYLEEPPGGGAPVFDPSVKRYSSTLDLHTFFAALTHRVRVSFTIRADHTSVLQFFSDTALGTDLKIGVRGLVAPGGGRINELWMGFRNTSTLKKYGVFQFFRHDFVLSSQDEPVFYNQTLSSLNGVTWLAQSDTATEIEIQTELDAMADAFSLYLDTPAIP